MNVLSLFDGMSCGQQALERCGIEVEKYFASEIDKHAIAVTQKNYPNTIQLGNVVDIYGSTLGGIDLLIGGSPCQSFSFAGKRKGMSTKCEIEILDLEHYLQLKREGYEFEGQSYLFWEYMRLMKEVKPKYFLLENVEMGEKWEKVLSKAIGVNGIHINSALVSAQNRKRIYWTNIGMKPSGLFGDLETIIQQPKDKGILLKNILETEVDKKYFLSDKMMEHLNTRKDNYNSGKINYKTGDDIASCINASSGCIDISDNIIVHNTMPRSSTTNKGGTGPLSREDGKTYCLDTGNTNAVEIKLNTVIDFSHRNEGLRYYEDKHPTLTQRIYKEPTCFAVRGRDNGEGINIQQVDERKDGKTNTITIVQKDNLVMEIKNSQVPQSQRIYDIKGKAITICGEGSGGGAKTGLYKVSQLNKSKESGGQQPYQQNRVYDENGLMVTLDTRSDQKNVYTDNKIRRLTPIEYERLQTVKDNYTESVSDTQRYRMLGNGWTVDVIAHIFNYLPKN